MPETNLFEIQATDEDGSAVAEPTERLRSLGLEEQRSKLSHYISDLEGEYEMVADGAERAHLSKLLAAARRYLADLQRPS